MRETGWTDANTRRALTAWRVYQEAHDLTARAGQAVGIDPATGRVWFGANATDVAHAAANDGVSTPLLALRVGADYYVRKDGHRSR